MKYITSPKQSELDRWIMKNFADFVKIKTIIYTNEIEYTVLTKNGEEYKTVLLT